MDGLAGIAKSAAALAFDVAGSAKTTAVFHTGKTAAYDPATDSNTKTGGQDITVEGIFYRGKQTERTDSNAVEAEFLILGSDLPNGIDEADTATIEGSTWNISGIELGPQKAFYKVMLRK